jgi:hypothetical protein
MAETARSTRGNFILTAQVGLNGGKTSPQRLNLFCRFMRDPAIHADDIAPGQDQRHTLTQPGITTRHDGDLTRKVKGVQYHMHLCMLIYASNNAVAQA